MQDWIREQNSTNTMSSLASSLLRYALFLGLGMLAGYTIFVSRYSKECQKRIQASNSGTEDSLDRYTALLATHQETLGELRALQASQSSQNDANSLRTQLATLTQEKATLQSQLTLAQSLVQETIQGGGGVSENKNCALHETLQADLRRWAAAQPLPNLQLVLRRKEHQVKVHFRPLPGLAAYTFAQLAQKGLYTNMPLGQAVRNPRLFAETGYNDRGVLWMQDDTGDDNCPFNGLGFVERGPVYRVGGGKNCFGTLQGWPADWTMEQVVVERVIVGAVRDEL